MSLKHSIAHFNKAQQDKVGLQGVWCLRQGVIRVVADDRMQHAYS
jgi:hypothetical protein